MSRLRLLSRAPETPIEWLAWNMTEYLYLPDPAPLYALMGTLAANILEGPPVWLMLVGPSGIGKTELLNSLGGIPGMQAVDSVDGPAAFLSGTGVKERGRNATGGLLHTVGLHGGIIIKDFTGILSLEPSRRKMVLDCLRQTYDGRWTRPVGSDGGRVLRWPVEKGKYGHAALFAGVTSEIDQHHQVNASLGERWLYFRMGAGHGMTAEDRETEKFARTHRIAVNAGRSGWREELENMVTAFVMGQDLEFGRRVKRRNLTGVEVTKIAKMADIAAMCRSAVPRDPYKRDVIGVPETESFGRMSAQLNQLFIGMESIGVSERERWRVLARVALDSMPLMRRIIVREAWLAGEKGVSWPTVVKAVGAGESTVRKAVEDLELHGVVVRTKSAGSETQVRLSRYLREEWDWKEWGN